MFSNVEEKSEKNYTRHQRSNRYTAGQTVGIIVTETREQAKRAADAVVVKYQELPSILTIDEAIAARSSLRKHSIVDGDVMLRSNVQMSWFKVR